MSITREQYAQMLCRTQPKRAASTEGVAREKDLHEQIQEFCASKGWICIHSRYDRPATNQAGTPDCIIATDDGRTLWVELKRRGGKCSPAQNAMLAWLVKNKQKAFVASSLQEFVELCR